MIIFKKRINSMGHFSYIKSGEKIIIGINNAERFPSKCGALGFPPGTSSGARVLPSKINTATKQNAEPFSIPDKSKPKETAYRTHWWTRHEWAGRGETREVTEFVEIPYKRYPKIEFPPYSVELTYICNSEGTKISTDAIIFTESNYNLIKNTVNIFLTTFGECEILNEQLEGWTSSRIIRLNWDVLPPGEYPWEKIQEDIERITKKSSETHKKIIMDKSEYINGFHPDFRAYGKSGFSGYVIFGFRDKNLYVLESIYPNNATYVFNEEWEELSKLTKAEILNGSLHNARLIHRENWKRNIKNVIEKND